MDSTEFRQKLKQAIVLVKQVKDLKSNEANTRRHIDKVLELLCGYDALKNLTREYSVKGVGDSDHADFVVQSKPNQIDIVIEIKRADLKLTSKHVKQGSRYCFDLGCSWMILTNAVEWRLYKVLFSKPADVVLVESWNILEDSGPELETKFGLISLAEIKRNTLEKLWEKKSALRKEIVLDAMLSEPALILIRKIIRKKTGVLVHSEDLISAFRSLLNEGASACMDAIDIKLPIKSNSPKKIPNKTVSEKSEPELPNSQVSQSQVERRVADDQLQSGA